jgi:hypothetical protein
MTDPGQDVDARWEDDGLPALGDETQDEALPGDREHAPASLDWGTTPDEESRDEPLDARLAREEPDVPLPVVETAESRGLTAEESAVHVVEEGHGLTD